MNLKIQKLLYIEPAGSVMPHVVVEYSANIEQLDRPKLLKRINRY